MTGQADRVRINMNEDHERALPGGACCCGQRSGPRNAPTQDDCTYRNPPVRFVRGLLALLATPLLLLAMLVIGLWLTTSGKLTAALVSGEDDRPVSTSPGPPIKRRLPLAPATRLLRTFAVISEKRRND